MEVFVVVMTISAFGYTAQVVPQNPKYHTAFTTESECRKLIPVVKRELNLPTMAVLKSVSCKAYPVKQGQ